MTLETIAWRGTHVELPDSDTTVLVYMPLADEPVWLGWYCGPEEGWRVVSGENVPHEVAAWAAMPTGAA